MENLDIAKKLESLQQEWIEAKNEESKANIKRLEIEVQILNLIPNDKKKVGEISITRAKTIKWNQEKIEEVIKRHKLEAMFETKIEYKAKKELFDDNKNLSALLTKVATKDLEEILEIKDNKPTFSLK